MKYTDMPRLQLKVEKHLVQKAYHKYKAKGLDLNMDRGKPNPSQAETILDMLDVVNSKSDNYISEEGFDILNYGCLTGLSEIKTLLSETYDIPDEKIIVGGNSSLTMMFDYLMQCYAKGADENLEPWCKQGDVKFLCVVPGYDRHFSIAEYLGIKMVNVPMTETGPDIDLVEELVKDPLVKGMFCVPQYSNPTGTTYSDETVRRLAAMETAPDFRIVWDNAYGIHDLMNKEDRVLDLLSECEKAGHPERCVLFASTSKISFPGAGIAFLAANEPNYSWILDRMQNQAIGNDKVNMMRHALYFKNKDGMMDHMKTLAEIITPRFNIVLDTFEKELGSLGIAEWTNPNGGYFISLDVMEGCATRVYDLARGAGVSLTPVGATFPYGKDPNDENIRIAPTFPSEEDLQEATNILVLCIKLACLEKLLDEKKD
ncbi:MAG: aminotransferase class I/II-fold pyridoxal phosphate-dependent enzyme [Clostridia bacterium]|nr:aminotransferase class I/II-fold pyridoxal phosphate-dependent enzyme [Clostridia bacterium]